MYNHHTQTAESQILHAWFYRYSLLVWGLQHLPRHTCSVLHIKRGWREKKLCKPAYAHRNGQLHAQPVWRLCRTWFVFSFCTFASVLCPFYSKALLPHDNGVHLCLLYFHASLNVMSLLSLQGTVYAMLNEKKNKILLK